MRRLALALTLLVLLATAASAEAAVHLRQIARFSGVPTYIAQPQNDARLFVTLQAGEVQVRVNGHWRLFLDLRGRVQYNGGEQGLLSIAFHPRFRSNGRLFVYYSLKGTGDVEIDEFRARGNRVVSGSRRLVLRIPHRQAANHNGGQLQFGPDGYLWIGTGDGGACCDTFNHAQDHNSLLGKLLRIDVNHAKPYTIPPTNPFAHGGGRREIWAIGLRNPWRFSFDRATGKLWIGDVGQDKIEEIDSVSSVVRSGFYNFGWGRYEGRSLFNRNKRLTGGTLTFPVGQYTHSLGNVIVGGYVYRGPVKALRGTYLYADDGAGWIRGFRKRLVLDNVGPVTSFGEGANGNVYVTVGNGRVLQFVA